MLAAGSMVRYKAFTLIPNDPLTDERSVKAKIATGEKMRLLGRLLSPAMTYRDGAQLGVQTPREDCTVVRR
jgi:hypothetical protein